MVLFLIGFICCQKGEGTNCDGFCYNFSGIGIENAAKIFFNSETISFSSGMSIELLRMATINVAEDLFFNYLQQVKDAWNAVGVYDDSFTGATEITGNTIWNNSRSVIGNITIDNGATLTITSTAKFLKKILKKYPGRIMELKQLLNQLVLLQMQKA